MNELIDINKCSEFEFTKYTFTHKRCHHINVTSQFRKEINNIFLNCKIEIVAINEITNCYCSGECCSKWLEVFTTLGKFIIGWRKHVMSLELELSDINFEEVFSAENVTTWSC